MCNQPVRSTYIQSDLMFLLFISATALVGKRSSAPQNSASKRAKTTETLTTESSECNTAEIIEGHEAMSPPIITV